MKTLKGYAMKSSQGIEFFLAYSLEGAWEKARKYRKEVTAVWLR
jgi:hypothetical protein